MAGVIHIRRQAPWYKIGLWFFLFLSVFLSVASARPWTNTEGVVLEGELLAVDGNVVVIQRKSDGRHFRIPVATLSVSDRKVISKVVKESKPGSGLIIPLPKAITDSLKAYYAFDKKDQMGKDSSGTRSPLAKDLWKMDWSEAGLVGGAASFNGRNSIFWMRRLMLIKNQPLTISCWIKTKSTVEQEVLSFGGANQGLAIFTENRSAGYAYRWGQGERFAEIKQSRYEVTDGQWHHLCAITDQSGNVTLWVNAVKAGPRTGELIVAEPTFGATMGSVSKPKGDNVRRTRSSKPFNGLIDEFMIFDRALKDLEISELYGRFKPFAKN